MVNGPCVCLDSENHELLEELALWLGEGCSLGPTRQIRHRYTVWYKRLWHHNYGVLYSTGRKLRTLKGLTIIKTVISTACFSWTIVIECQPNRPLLGPTY
jgi:hypothetical protein